MDQLLCLTANIQAWLACQTSSLHARLHVCNQWHSNDGWDWCELKSGSGAGQRLRPCSAASARRRPVSRGALEALLGLTLPLLVAALPQLHRQKVGSLAAPNGLQGLQLAAPPSPRLADLSSLEDLPPSAKQGAVLAVLVNLGLVHLPLARTKPQPSVKQGGMLAVLVNLSSAVLLLAKRTAAPLEEGLDLAVEQVRHRLAHGSGSRLVGAQVERKGWGLTRAISRHLQPADLRLLC